MLITLKRESQILPENLAVYCLKEFFEAELSKSLEFRKNKILSAAVIGSDGGSNENSERWFNEGGR